jgi:Ca2+-binding EF-hand superfamily protein
MAQPAAPAAADRLMQADANGDGRITKDEIRAQRLTIFARMDVNSDGVVNVEDRPAAAEGQAKTKRRRGGDYARFDADNDGKVTQAEFVDRDYDGFDRLDANKDGAIDASEREALQQRRGARKAQ